MSAKNASELGTPKPLTHNHVLIDSVLNMHSSPRHSQILKFLFNEDQPVEGGTSIVVTVLAIKLCLYLNIESSDWKNLMLAALKVVEWCPEVLLKVRSQGKKVHELGEIDTKV